MTCASLDADVIVAADGHPGDPGRAQVVEGDLLAREIICEELGAGDACPAQVLAQALR